MAIGAATIGAMAIDPEVLCEHVKKRGRYLHHVTPREAVPSVLEQGLVPGSQLGHRQHGGFFETRADHVYLSDLLTVAVVEIPGERALLAVDLCQLNPELIDPDEDMVQQSFWSSGGRWLDHDEHPPIRQMEEGSEVQGQDGALASWAEETEGFDAPQITAKSLNEGRIAYSGVVPPAAIEEIHHPSEGCAFFATTVASELGEAVELPAGPPLGFYRTEIGRAYALAACVIDGSMRLVTAVDWEGGTKFTLPEQALDVADHLRAIARGLRHGGDFERSELPGAAAALADAVSEFQPEVGWSSNRDQCVVLAERATDCVRLVKRDHGENTAEDVARGALESALAVPA